MNNGVKILGHSVHPILIVFPLGLLSTAVIFEIAFYVTNTQVLAVAAYWMLFAGVIGGVLAAIFGWLDWFAIPSDTRAKRVGLIHGLVNAVALILFAASWYFRSESITSPPIAATVLSLMGFLFAGVGGWLGGELVERLGIGVHEGANPNAPSSLAKDPPLSSRVNNLPS